MLFRSYSSYNDDANANRKTYFEAGSTNNWWLRTPILNNMTDSGVVITSGSLNNISLTNASQGLNFGFCIGNTPTEYTVTYDANNGAFAPSGTTNVVSYRGKTVTSGEYKEPTRSGYDFDGWNTAPNGSGTSYADHLEVKKSATTGTLYAKWAPQTENGLYVGHTEYETLTLDGAILLSPTSNYEPSVLDNKNNYIWQSNNTNVATVSEGIVQCGNKTGTATIRCYDLSNNVVGKVIVTSTAKIVKAKQNVNETYNGGTAGYNNPTIPAGYRAIDVGIGTSDEATWSQQNESISKGLTIMDDRGNQFVWVPVQNVIGTPSTTNGVDLASNPSTARPMAKLQSGS